MNNFLRFALCIGLFFFGLGCTRHKKEIGDRVLERVNKRELTARTFSDELGRRLHIYDALTVKDVSHLKQVKEDILRDFVIQSISEDYARDHNLLVKKEELDTEFNFIRSNYPNDEAFRKAIADQGLNEKDWLEKLRTTLLHRLIVRELHKNLAVPTADEIQAYYKANHSDFQAPDQVRLRQVVVANETDAEAIQDELRHGRSLSDLAKKFSLTPEGQKGGDTGWIDRGTLDVFDRAFKMDRHQRSGIVKSDFGYHIFEVLDKRRAQTLPFEEVKARILRTLIEKREQAAYSHWLESELQKSHVVRDDVFISRIRVETKSEE